MNRPPLQTPPRWWSPKLSRRWVRFWRPVRRRLQRYEQGLEQIDIAGLELVRAAREQGHGVLIAPNHPSHADHFVVYEAADRLNCPFYFMTAWQSFAVRGWLGQLVLRQHGCFSVDREGVDMRAFRQAVQILEAADHPLVIFPEGEVYHQNDRVTPFRDGVGAIALSAVKRAQHPVCCIPTGIKYRYVQDPTPELSRLMDRLEDEIFWRPRPDLPLQQRIYRFAEGALALKELEYLGHTQSGPLPERIAALSAHVLAGLETKHEVTPAEEATVPERVKELRRRVIKKIERLPPDRPSRKNLENDLDDLMLVVQLFSYPGDYVAERPTVERMAETLDKFEEDVLERGVARARGRRHASLAFGEPITVRPQDRRGTTPQALTQEIEDRVQALLDGMDRTH